MASPIHSDPALADLQAPIRRYVAAHADPAMVDDVVQETLARVVEQRDRLTDEALVPYALVTARNLLATDARRAAGGRRNRHRLFERNDPERPEDVLLRQEEERSIRDALADLTPDERDVLLAHELGDASTRDLAGPRRTSPGAMAVRLAATRAKLRVAYLLQYRGVELPTDRCRAVLVSLSAGDRRRQAALDAGGHLSTCATCASLSEPLLDRRRALAAWWPFVLVPVAWRAMRNGVRSHPVAASAGGVAAGAAATAAIVFGGGGSPPPPPPPPLPGPPVTVVIAAQPVRSLPSAVSAPDASPVQVTRGRILHVPADEGFWLAATESERIWVQLLALGESGAGFEAGETVTFAGRLAHHGPGYAASVGVDGAEGAAELDAAAAHIEVPAPEVRETP